MMKMQSFKTTQAALLSTLSAVTAIVERRNTIPILGALRFADGKITGTNLDREVTASLGLSGKIDEPFSVAAGQLERLVRHIPKDDEITVSTEGVYGGAQFAFNGNAYSIIGYPAADFPEFKAADFGPQQSIHNAGIIAAMKRVRFAISNEETRYYLNGVYFGNYNGAPVIVATDGHRLAMQTIAILPDALTGLIVPHGLVDYLVSRKVEPNFVAGAISTSGAPSVRFDYDGLTVKARTIDGTFPDFTRVIPKAPTKRATFDRQKLLTALKRIAAMIGRDMAFVKLSFGQSLLTLSIKNPNWGNGSENLTSFTKHFAGGYEVGFNARYLIEALACFTGSDVTLSQDDAGSPATITAEGDSLLVVLMPMRD